MNLTNDQQKALDSIGEWLKRPDDWMFYLGGYAGTGKTTLMTKLISMVDKAPMCLAPTGKAASVLQKRVGSIPVTTIHRALYQPVMPDTSELMLLELKLQADPKSEELKKAIKEEKERLANLKLRFNNRDTLEILPGDFIIVDEASMVNNRMLDDFGKTGAKVLFVGDPGQLPPVNDAGYFTYTKPDAMLTEIVRQAADNPIIRWSMKIRKGESVPERFDDGKVVKMPMKGFEIAKFTDRDQILCGTNTMRQRLNRSLRKLAGIAAEDWMPCGNEKIICLKNRFKFDTWFINGIQAYSCGNAHVNDEGDWVLSMLYEGKAITDLPVYSYPFESHYNFKAEQEPWPMRSHLIDFDYAYAITVHKSQGSEWEKVALIDDGIFDKDIKTKRKWLYTAITRAKDNLLWLAN